MSDALREAAAKALSDLEPLDGSAEVTRVTLDVSCDGRSELVSVTLRDGAIAWTSTGEPLGPHARAALRWLAGGAGDARPAVRTVASAESPLMSWTPTDPDGPRERLAAALEDVVTTVVRTGTANASSPSITESLERLKKEAPLPIPSGLARWAGRLRTALDRGDDPLVARLLYGASLFARSLREAKPSREAKSEVVSWTGTGAELTANESLSDRTMVEVSREQLATSDRGGIERRYLADLQNGEIFREERSRAAASASVGPCPRVVTVGLAEVEDGASPRRLRLMQYSVTPSISADEVRRLGANGYRRFTALADRYRDQIAAHPGQAEPFAIVAPRRWDASPDPMAYDDEGAAIAFSRADDGASVDVLSRLIRLTPLWVAGRLTDHEGALMMVPCAVGLPEGGGARLMRLR
ncbi:MAG: hypothetical protein AB7S26_19785 [Sandaracinaceae bacterium]